VVARRSGPSHLDPDLVPGDPRRGFVMLERPLAFREVRGSLTASDAFYVRTSQTIPQARLRDGQRATGHSYEAPVVMDAKGGRAATSCLVR